MEDEKLFWRSCLGKMEIDGLTELVFKESDRDKLIGRTLVAADKRKPIILKALGPTINAVFLSPGDSYLEFKQSLTIQICNKHYPEVNAFNITPILSDLFLINPKTTNSYPYIVTFYEINTK